MHGCSRFCGEVRYVRPGKSSACSSKEVIARVRIPGMWEAWHLRGDDISYG